MDIVDKISALKHGTGSVPVCDAVTFQAIGTDLAADRSLAERHARWRNDNRDAFRSTNPTSAEATGRWLRDIAANQPTRLIFELRRPEDGFPFGTLGLSAAPSDDAPGQWFLESVLRGEVDAPKDAMKQAIEALVCWMGVELGAESIRVNCFADMTAAIALYHRCGFRPVDLIALTPVPIENGIRWDEAPPETKAERFYIVLDTHVRH